MYKYTVIDAHCDTLRVISERGEGLHSNSGMVSGEMLSKYCRYVQVFATWVDEKCGDTFGQALRLADKFREEIDKCGFVHIKDSKALNEVIKNGKIGAILSLEDGVALGGEIKRLYELYNLGFRLITLTWNGVNEIACGAFSGERGGLTDFGRKVVREMNRLGMVVDLSHISEEGFWDVLALSAKPVVASHSNAKAICNHSRNLTDDQIVALIKSRGVIGLSVYPDFLGGRDSNIISVIRHVEHILSLGGEGSVGIGTDFDGIKICASGIENAGKLYRLFDEMQKIGYSDELIDKVSYKNFLRLFSECLI